MLGINEICNELNALADQHARLGAHFARFHDGFRAFVAGQPAGLHAGLAVGERVEHQFTVDFLDRAFTFELAIEAVPEQLNLRGVVRCYEAPGPQARRPEADAGFTIDAAGYLDEINEADGQPFYLPHPGVAPRIGLTVLLDAVRK